MGIVKKSGAWYMFGEDQLGQGRARTLRLFSREHEDLRGRIESAVRVEAGLPGEKAEEPVEEETPGEKRGRCRSRGGGGGIAPGVTQERDPESEEECMCQRALLPLLQAKDARGNKAQGIPLGILSRDHRKCPRKVYRTAGSSTTSTSRAHTWRRCSQRARERAIRVKMLAKRARQGAGGRATRGVPGELDGERGAASGTEAVPGGSGAQAG